MFGSFRDEDGDDDEGSDRNKSVKGGSQAVICAKSEPSDQAGKWWMQPSTYL